MPIPRARNFDDGYIRMDVGQEVLRARMNQKLSFSFINKDFLADFPNWRAYNYQISLPIKCNGNFGYASFLIHANLGKEDAILGSDFFRRFDLIGS